MIQVQSLRRRSWAGPAWLGVIAIGVLVAVFNSLIGALLLGLTLVAFVAAVLSARPAAHIRAPRLVAGTPVAQRVVYASDGAEYSAIVVAAEPADAYQMVLTSAGYRLVDGEGRIVYTLKPAS